MTDKLLEIKSTIVLGFTAFSTILGWQGIMAAVWVVMMLLDYITGSVAAAKNGQWSSEVARNGIWHKMGMLVVVIVAGFTDLIMAVVWTNIYESGTWSAFVLPVVLAWYILTEMGSILENAVRMGAKVPFCLVKILKQGLKTVESFGTDEQI